jgi:hypothetical protein
MSTSVSGASTGAAGNAICDIKAPATVSSNLIEFSMSFGANNGNCFYSLGRATVELLQLAAVKFLSEESVSDLSETTFATAWSVAPVAPVQSFRRHAGASFSTTQGGFIWCWPRGLKIGPSTSMVLYTTSNGTVAPAYIYAEIDE